MKKRTYFILILCFTFIEICSVFLLWKSLSAKETILEDVKLKEIDKNNSLAIMIEQDDGTYQESSSKTWPTDMVFNETLSGCIDNSGNRIENSLTYDKDTNIATVSTESTSYCYLYFDKILPLVGEYLLNSPTTGLNTTMEGGLYRYQGTSADNYICFGTSDKSTCTGNTDAYMYRIIGINADGQLKLIKKEALNSTYQWYSDYIDITWPNSDLYKAINGSTYLTNSTYMPSGWSSKIADTTWKYGDNTTSDTTAANLYSTEKGWSNTINAKIGLMYAHDYYYGLAGGNNCSAAGAYTTCKTSWLHLSNCDSEAPSAHEWTMSRYGYYIGYYTAWDVRSDGGVYVYTLSNDGVLRPVFYLNADEMYVSGSGTADDPIIIN